MKTETKTTFTPGEPVNGTMSIPAKQWLKELFEYENCPECGRGARGHTAVPFMFGNWFARCNPKPQPKRR